VILERKEVYLQKHRKVEMELDQITLHKDLVQLMQRLQVVKVEDLIDKIQPLELMEININKSVIEESLHLSEKILEEFKDKRLKNKKKKMKLKNSLRIEF
jgi:hypothetical protein